MQINIQSLHFRATPLLEEHVTQKVNKLVRLNDRITTCDVYLRLDKALTGENKVCEIKLHVPGQDLFAKRQAESFEEATNEAVHALQEQLHKIKA
jgi:ribosomal subunit interface protein